MDKINGLPDELLVKILSFVPTKVAVSTSILSKRWEFLWMWMPKLDFNDYKDIDRSESSCLRYRDFISKNLPLHRAPIIESLSFCLRSVQPEDLKLWVAIAVSRFVRELYIYYASFPDEPGVVFPSSLYTCKSLLTLKLDGKKILVDVPRTGCFPSLKTLQLRSVTYSNEDSLRLLLSYCPALEDLAIEREGDNNVKALVVMVPSLQRLALWIYDACSSDGYVIDTPSLKYFKVEDFRDDLSYMVKHMPELEGAYITVTQGLKEFLEPITSVKRLSLEVFHNNEEESMYRSGIVFDQLEHLELSICESYWSKLLVRLLNDSPKLRVLNISVDQIFLEHERISWSNEQSSVPLCLSKSLETFEFAGYKGKPEERDFLSFFLKNARCLKSKSILRSSRKF